MVSWTNCFIRGKLISSKDHVVWGWRLDYVEVKEHSRPFGFLADCDGQSDYVLWLNFYMSESLKKGHMGRAVLCQFPTFQSNSSRECLLSRRYLHRLSIPYSWRRLEWLRHRVGALKLEQHLTLRRLPTRHLWIFDRWALMVGLFWPLLSNTLGRLLKYSTKDSSNNSSNVLKLWLRGCAGWKGVGWAYTGYACYGWIWATDWT